MNFLKTVLLLLVFSTILSAKYTNCEFKNKDYSDVCKKVVKQGVSYKYANQFLLSYMKTQKFDAISWKYLQPKHIKAHRENEKKANNVLVKYVPKMVTNLKKYKKVYDKAEKKYGVNREIIAGILMKETKLGKIKPTHDAFVVFNTIVVRTKAKTSRQKWLLKLGKTNMVSIITHCYKAKLKPTQCNLPSSYAGAIGIPQFMPNSFVYADSYRGRTPDLTKMEDAILSCAKFLNKKATFNKLINWKKMPDIVKVEADWYEYAYTHKNASFVYKTSKSGKKYSCFTAGKKDLSYMKEYVKKIMRYNNSSNYAVGVIRLAYDAHKILLHLK
jgi:membrane-bound lytic murein transglycosylase B